MKYDAELIARLSKVKGDFSKRQIQYLQKRHDIEETLWRNVWLGMAGTAFAKSHLTEGELSRLKQDFKELGLEVQEEEVEGNECYLVHIPGVPISRQLDEKEMEEVATTNVYIQSARAQEASKARQARSTEIEVSTKQKHKTWKANWDP